MDYKIIILSLLGILALVYTVLKLMCHSFLAVAYTNTTLSLAITITVTITIIPVTSITFNYIANATIVAYPIAISTINLIKHTSDGGLAYPVLVILHQSPP